MRIKDVAENIGVSTATVSRVLAGKPHVREEVRRKVLAAVEQLGYRPSRVARSLRVRQSSIIGILISDIQNPFFTSIVRAAEDIAHEQGFTLFLCNTDEDPEKEQQYLEVMLAESVAGVIITPVKERNSFCQSLIEAGIPVVAIDRRLRDLKVDTVLVSNKKSTQRLISSLIEQGHRRIGMVLGPLDITSFRERYEGYKAALKAHGIPLDESLVKTDAPRRDVGRGLVGELLSLKDRPTALFTTNNLLCIGAYQAIRERGLKMPDDVTLATFDKMDWMELAESPPMCIEQPTYELGRAAAQLLVQRLEEPKRKPQEVVFEAIVHISAEADRNSQHRG